jgi:glycosyltransferase involved in cell wall biosynthesis
MKVVHAISSIDVRSGGTASAFINLTIAQQRSGLDVTAVTTFRDSEDLSSADEMRCAGVKVKLLGPSTGKLCRAPGMEHELRGLVADADVLHIHALWEEVQHRCAVEARRAAVPYLISPHGMLDPWSLAQRALKKKIYLAWRLRRDLNRAAAIHVTATAEQQLMRPLKLAAPVFVEGLGVDLNEFRQLPEKGWLRQKYPQIGGRPIVLFLSRLHYKKGLDLLLPAFAGAQTNDAVLVLAGPAEEGYLAELRDLARSHGIEERVIFTGMLRGIERVQAYVDAELFVLPSYTENFGIVVPEALASGCPVLVSDKVNISDQIAAAGVGGVVQTSVQSVRDGLSRWLNDAPLRQSASCRARDFVWSNFDWEQIGKHWVSHYERLTGRN